MDDLAVAAAIVLAGVFAWAGVAKLTKRDDTEASFRALGVPAVSLSARIVPIVELLLAVGLLVVPGIAAWFALVLLAAFTAVVWRAVQNGVAAPCSCFGSARKEPVSTTEIVRNAMLAALAVLATGAPATFAWPALPAVVIVTVGVAIGRVVLGVVDLRRSAGSLWPPLPGEQAR